MLNKTIGGGKTPPLFFSMDKNIFKFGYDDIINIYDPSIEDPSKKKIASVKTLRELQSKYGIAVTTARRGLSKKTRVNSSVLGIEVALRIGKVSNNKQ